MAKAAKNNRSVKKVKGNKNKAASSSFLLNQVRPKEA